MTHQLLLSDQSSIQYPEGGMELILRYISIVENSVINIWEVCSSSKSVKQFADNLCNYADILNSFTKIKIISGKIPLTQIEFRAMTWFI